MFMKSDTAATRDGAPVFEVGFGVEVRFNLAELNHDRINALQSHIFKITSQPLPKSIWGFAHSSHSMVFPHFSYYNTEKFLHENKEVSISLSATVRVYEGEGAEQTVLDWLHPCAQDILSPLTAVKGTEIKHFIIHVRTFHERTTDGWQGIRMYYGMDKFKIDLLKGSASSKSASLPKNPFWPTVISTSWIPLTQNE